MSYENLEKIPQLEIEHSVETELERLSYVLSPVKRKFYQERKYRITLPEGFSLDDEEPVDEEKLKAQIEKEVAENRVLIEERKTEISGYWPNIIEHLKPVFRDLNYQPPENYILTLSLYGTGGSYNPPNEVIVNIKNKSSRNGLEKTIAHEAVHDSIEHLIRKYQIEHWIKERIVDLLMSKAYPDYQTQKLPIDTTEITRIFDENYPNLEKALEEISQLKTNN